MILKKTQVKSWFSTLTHPTVSAALLFGLSCFPAWRQVSRHTSPSTSCCIDLVVGMVLTRTRV